MLEVFFIIAMLAERVFLQTVGIHMPYGYQLCSSSHRLVPLFPQSRLHAGASKKTSEDSPIF